jgi:hypothetical protein
MIRKAGYALVGAAAFGAAHVLLRVRWDLFGPAHDAWFLNSGSAAALTFGVTAGGAVYAALVSRTMGETVGASLSVGAGAAVAAAVVLFTLPGGPGTIFPVVLTMATAGLMACALAAATITFAVRSTLRTRPRT